MKPLIRAFWIRSAGAALAAALVAACATPSTKMQNASGHVVTCSAQGYGALGATSAVLMHQDCVERLRANGYTEVDTANVAPPAVKTGSSSLQFPLPSGWAAKPMTASQAAGGGQVNATNPTIDAGVLVSQAAKAGVTDFVSYSAARRAATASRLKGASWSDLQEEVINGKRAWRYWVKGDSNGLVIQFHGTVIEGSDSVLLVNAWTSAANYPAHQSHLESLAALASGF